MNRHLAYQIRLKRESSNVSDQAIIGNFHQGLALYKLPLYMNV